MLLTLAAAAGTATALLVLLLLLVPIQLFSKPSSKYKQQCPLSRAVVPSFLARVLNDTSGLYTALPQSVNSRAAASSRLKTYCKRGCC
jgi:hypothetical protein